MARTSEAFGTADASEVLNADASKAVKEALGEVTQLPIVLQLQDGIYRVTPGEAADAYRVTKARAADVTHYLLKDCATHTTDACISMCYMLV